MTCPSRSRKSSGALRFHLPANYFPIKGPSLPGPDTRSSTDVLAGQPGVGLLGGEERRGMQEVPPPHWPPFALCPGLGRQCTSPAYEIGNAQTLGFVQRQNSSFSQHGMNTVSSLTVPFTRLAHKPMHTSGAAPPCAQKMGSGSDHQPRVWLKLKQEAKPLGRQRDPEAASSLQHSS